MKLLVDMNLSPEWVPLLAAGALLTISGHRVRLRRLPLVPRPGGPFSFRKSKK